LRVPAQAASVSAVSEVLISLRLPASMTESEMRSWITSRAQSCKPALVLTGDESSAAGLLLHVDARPDPTASATEQLIDLITDMRLLGLRPAIVPDDG
jgi:hypothetical protein